MLRLTSPVETYKYIDEVVTKFDNYVGQDLLPKLSTPDLSPDQILTGLQFIRTRELPEFQGEVLELLTTYHAGKQAKKVYASALQTAEWYDIAPRKLVRALVSSMLSKAHVQRDPLYEQAVQEMARPAALVMLDMIKPHRKAHQRRRLVNLVRQAGGVKPPYPSPRWARSPDEELTEMKEAWEKSIDPSGEVRQRLEQAENPPPPQTQPSPTPDGSG